MSETRCPGCGRVACEWPRLECDRPVIYDPNADYECCASGSCEVCRGEVSS